MVGERSQGNAEEKAVLPLIDISLFPVAVSLDQNVLVFQHCAIHDSGDVAVAAS